MAADLIKMVQALDKLRAYNLYVHNDIFDSVEFEIDKLKNRKVYLVETLATLNALVDNGTMLLFGGHGGGKTTLSKYLGQIFYQLSVDKIEDCMLRGHPQLTEEKILGSLDISQLTGRRELTGGRNIDVIWNKFVDSPWKIIDEINRLTPYAQNILLSLLAEGTVKYHNSAKVLPAFTLFATMNPKDEGNVNLSLPFLDRFALALPITMPDYESLLTIGKRGKSFKSDSLSNYLPNFNLTEYQDAVRKLPVSDEAEFYINLIISEFRLCERVVKEATDTESVDGTLCKGCRFEDSSEKVCNKVVNPLSVRVKEDLFRYSKALAWFLGSEKVSVKHVEVLAPYLIWHRSNISRKYKKQLQDKKFAASNLSINLNLEACKEIVGMISKDFIFLKGVQFKYNKLKKGELSQLEFDEFKTMINDPNHNDLLIKMEIRRVLNNEYYPVYSSILEVNSRINGVNQVEVLKALKEEVLFNYELPNRQFLVDEIDRKINKVNAEQYRPVICEILLEDFYEKLLLANNELTERVNIKFHNEFIPELMKPYILFSAADDGFDLKMTKLPSKLKFEYTGPKTNVIFTYIEQTKIG